MSLVQIDIDELAQALNLLGENPDVIISEEPRGSQIQRAVNTVTMAFTILKDTNYDLMHNILEKLPRPTRLKNESVGSFLFGDYLMCYGDSTRKCSTLALHSVPRRERVNYTKKSDPCPDQVWLLKTGHNNKKHYAAVSSSNSSKALIYIDVDTADEFLGFTKEEIQLFKDNGILEVEVYTVGNPTHTVIIPCTKIEDLPINHDETGNSVKLVNNNVSSFVDSDDDGGCCWWWWVILIIIILVLFCCFLYYGGYLSRDGYMQYPQQY